MSVPGSPLTEPPLCIPQGMVPATAQLGPMLPPPLG
jgi:hypothetical protein